ncbi:MAG: hypothetical protein R3B47_12280 [Bacteroidia bacterium]
MPKYFFFTLFLLATLGLQLHAQKKSSTEDVLYLKNGSVLRGIVVERVPGSHVTIRMVGESELRVEESEIEKLAQEKPEDYFLFKYMRNQKIRGNGLLSGRERGFAMQWNLTITGSTDQWGIFVPYPGLDTKAMFHTNTGWSYGLGTGVSPYGRGGIIPFYGEVQRLFGSNGQRARPYMFGQLGYGYGAWDNWSIVNFTGGVMGRAGGGYVLTTRRRTEWIFSLSLGLQPMSWENLPWDWPAVIGTESQIAPAVQLGMGMGI